MKKCLYCGALNDDDAIFCVSCGLKMSKNEESPSRGGDPPKTCPYCGTLNDKDASYCIECGMRIDENSADCAHLFGTVISKCVAVLESIFGPLMDRFLPPNARKNLSRYFYGTTLPGIFLVLGSCFFVINILIQNSAASMALRIITIICLVAAIAAELVNIFGFRAGMEFIYDRAIAADLQALGDRAYEFLHLDSEQTKDVNSVFLTGPCFEEVPHLGRKSYFHYWPRQIYRFGMDGRLRYSVVKTVAYYFTKNQLLVYNEIYDPVTGHIYDRYSKDYFYEDINSAHVGNEVKSVGYGKNCHKQSYITFSVESRSGNIEMGIAEMNNQVSESLRGMSFLVRERKSKIA